jgi:hypothetical protein
MINTPETDRLAEEFKRNTLPDDVKLDILFGFTRKLERECIRAEGETEKLERERAEARELAHRFRSLFYTQLRINKSGSWFPWEDTK